MKKWMLPIAAAMALGTGQANAACSPDYSGVSLTVGSQVGPFIASAFEAAGKSWAEQTCGEVEIVEFPFGELYPKFLTAMVANEDSFDVISFPPAWTPDFVPYLTEMPASIREADAWEDIHTVYRDRLMVWNGKHYTQTIDGDLHNLTYRTDLFEDAKEQSAFKAKYGYDLRLPQDWKEYLDIAEFFTRPDQGLWGTAEAFVRGGQQFWFFFTHVASYTNHPDHPGSMFFNPENMDAQVNNPGWVKALEDYVRASKLAPPGALNFNFGDVNSNFAGGKVAMSVGWGDTGVIAADPKQSTVNGKVGSAVTPGSKEVWNYKTGKWDSFDAPVVSPFMAFGGWQAAVPAASKKQEAAWHFIEWVSNPENSGIATVTGGSGVNPYRYSHFTDVDRWLSTFTRAEAEAYLAAQKDSASHPNVALDMRLPGYFSYTEILEIELSKALAGQVSAQEALDAVAEQWDALTDDFGRDTQLAAYRSSMGLPPL